MQTEIDEMKMKKKGESIYLRMFQLGGEIALSYWAVKYHGPQGSNQLCEAIMSYLAYSIIGMNLISITVIKCLNKFPMGYFYFTFIIDIILCGGILTLSFICNKNDTCVSNLVFSEFSLLETCLAVLICFFIIYVKLPCGERYIKSAGNFVWIPLFFGYNWSESFSQPMLIIGIICAFVSGTTIIIYLITCRSSSLILKKVLIIDQVISIALLLGCEIYALITVLKANQPKYYRDIHALKTLAAFVLVNAFDILFWLWGCKEIIYDNDQDLNQEMENHGQFQN